MIGLGLFMVELPKKSELPPGEESVRAFYFLLHKSLGLTAAILIAVRIVWRLTHKAPPLPDTISKLQQMAASSVHWLLYVLMIAMPLTGYLQSMYSKYPTYFWGIKLPRTAEADAAMRANFTDIHALLAYAFIAVLLVHIAGALKHKFDGSGITKRMSLLK
jgi:cytochrome b561